MFLEEKPRSLEVVEINDVVCDVPFTRVVHQDEDQQKVQKNYAKNNLKCATDLVQRSNPESGEKLPTPTETLDSKEERSWGRGFQGPVPCELSICQMFFTILSALRILIQKRTLPERVFWAAQMLHHVPLLQFAFKAKALCS